MLAAFSVESRAVTTGLCSLLKQLNTADLPLVLIISTSTISRSQQQVSVKMVHLRINWILNGDPKEWHESGPPLFCSSGFIMRSRWVYQLSSDYLALAKITGSANVKQLKEQRGLAEMLQVETIFFFSAPHWKDQPVLRTKKKRLRISAAEVEVSIGFNACLTCFLVLIQISAGLICHSSVHN